MNHIGFLVSDLHGMVHNLGQMRAIVDRPANRPFAEVRFTDPDGNRIDLSQTKGWEVAPAQWQRGTRSPGLAPQRDSAR
jgi:hypothetical protein